MSKFIIVDRKAITRNRRNIAEGMDVEDVFVVHEPEHPERRGKRILILTEPPVRLVYEPEAPRFHAVAWIETEAEVQVD